MNRGDTSLGGSHGAFPNTTWGLVSKLDATADDRRRAGLEELCRRYWKPVYRYIRMTRAKSNEDAKDLTQAFLAWLLQAEALGRYEPELGSFRRYLKVLLTRFVRDSDETLNRLKRGGGMKILPLSDEAASLEETLPDPKAVEPDKVFDRAWALEVTMQAIERVRRRMAGGPKAKTFALFEAYDRLPTRERPTYRDLAARFGMTESDVGHALESVREEVVRELRAELGDLTAGEGGVEEEWRALFGE